MSQHVNGRRFVRVAIVGLGLLLTLRTPAAGADRAANAALSEKKVFRAGACAVDVSPKKPPAITWASAARRA
jgi:hypothetical protein